MSGPVLFYGDPHKRWEPLFEEAARSSPEHVVIIGDLELERPFRETVAPLLSAGVRCWWILGNHDCHTEAQHDLLVADFPEGDLSGRVVTLSTSRGDVAVAGLGGHYKGRVFWPKEGGEDAPRWPTRDEFLRQQGKGGRWRGGLPIRQRDTIFQEDHRRLSALRCDVLVTHEAPVSVGGDMGFGGIDDLGREMGARWIVHGHHHRSYVGASRDGISVRGLGGAETAGFDPASMRFVPA